MQFSITLPDDVGRYIQENPKAGRRSIAEHFSVGDKQARLYAGGARMVAAAKKSPVLLPIEELDQCDVEEHLTPMRKALSWSADGA